MIFRFTTVIIQEGKWHVARAVELGVVSQGKTVQESLKNLKEAIELYLEDNPQFKKFASRQAPLITTLELSRA
ncbi:MAG: type II toxin-antitoxin system HicB family antitoxin [bacterium]|nr:type II toxin-antitoxin system HicB family antitoxin [bacterium]